jgi:hypothetical protein
LKQADEPGKGGKDEEQLVEGHGKQRHGQPLFQICRVIFRHFEPERRIQKQVKCDCDGDSGQGYCDEQCVSQLESKNRPMGVERMPRKDKTRNQTASGRFGQPDNRGKQASVVTSEAMTASFKTRGWARWRMYLAIKTPNKG